MAGGVAPMSDATLEVVDLVKHFPIGGGLAGSGGGVVHAVNGVSFTVAPGEVVGLVGESGSGKSTVGNCVLRLLEPTAGTIRLQGTDISHLSRRALRPLRREMHMVFQDPYSSLNPRMTNGAIVGEPLRLHGLTRSAAALEARVAELFDQVGLNPDLRHRYPHELSGGQRQRVGLARALSVGPSLLIADEPVSALDVSVQASILNLLSDLQEELGFACLFITHDLSIVEYFCHRVAVMYLGRIVETGTVAQIFARPQHPYTQALLSAAAVPDPQVQRARSRIVLEGDLPSPIDIPDGCPFRARCPLEHESMPRSEEERPELRDVDGAGHLVACHLARRGREVPRIASAEPAGSRNAGS
jgi:oligopeptide transport system ATP-binding protein